MSGDAGAFAECEVKTPMTPDKTLMTPDHTAFQVHSSGRFESELVGLPEKV